MPDNHPASDLDAIRQLVEGFRSNLTQLRDAQTSEASVRQEYIDPFWTALGWDVANRAHRSRAERDVVVEPSLATVEGQRLRSRRPDYLFRIDGFPRFIVEAKKPAVDLSADRDAIFQAKTYAWNAQIPFAILTDFEEFRLFDATIKPRHDEPDAGLVQDFDLRYENYLTQWDVLSATFGRQAVRDGSLEALLARIKRVRRGRRIRGIDRLLIDLRGSEPVDKAFLAHLENYRLRFARDLYRQNSSTFPDANTRHGAAKLTEAVQRLIDRLVFMRTCEDRDIAPYGQIRGVVNRAADQRHDLYPLLTREFQELNRQYNGYLFKPHFSESLTVSPDLLAEFVRSLYMPDGPYRFDAIGDDVLGIIYERFLASEITVTRNRVDAEEKPEIRHAGGVYYTPKFVVDTIVRRVIGPKIEGLAPLDVLDVKILDPACGSGSFLITAFQFLIDHCQNYIADHPGSDTVPATPRARTRTRPIAFQSDDGQWHLAPDFKSQLLTSCIHGVDIDAQAVEVTIMSLYLKMLEGRLPPNWQRDWLENQLLPPLENNVRCGNSLIDHAAYDAYVDETQGTLFPDDRELDFRINRFDWTSRTHGFGRLLDTQAVTDRGRAGFDCIIGNPPYIRVQELKKWAPEECEFYKWKYTSAAQGNYDIYVVFTEKALSLLAPDGRLGFIMPHKFWQAKYGQGLRELITQGKHLCELVDFTHNTVFRDASIYTGIHILSKRENTIGRLPVIRVNELTDALSQLASAERGVSVEGIDSFQTLHPLGSDPWLIVPPALSATMIGLQQATSILLGSITERMAQGIRTSMNAVYVLTKSVNRRNVFLSEYLGREVKLEPDLLLTFLGAEHMRRFEIRQTSNVVLVPYYTSGTESGSLISSSVLEDEFPATWAYLKQCENALRSRERGRMDHEEWFGYVYPKNLKIMGTSKIIVPDIIEQPSFSLDEDGQFAFVSGYGITLQPKFNSLTHFLLGLLNSTPLGQFLKAVSTPLRGGWYRPFPQFMEQIPIKLPETAAEKRLADRISRTVRDIMDAKIQLRDPSLSNRRRAQLDANLEAQERAVDEMVFRLYNVDPLPE